MGGKKLLCEGYKYVVDKKNGERTYWHYWRCEKRSYCSDRIVSDGKEIVFD